MNTPYLYSTILYCCGGQTQEIVGDDLLCGFLYWSLLYPRHLLVLRTFFTARTLPCHRATEIAKRAERSLVLHKKVIQMAYLAPTSASYAIGAVVVIVGIIIPLMVMVSAFKSKSLSSQLDAVPSADPPCILIMYVPIS